MIKTFKEYLDADNVINSILRKRKYPQDFEYDKESIEVDRKIIKELRKQMHEFEITNRPNMLGSRIIMGKKDTRREEFIKFRELGFSDQLIRVFTHNNVSFDRIYYLTDVEFSFCQGAGAKCLAEFRLFIDRPEMDKSIEMKKNKNTSTQNYQYNERSDIIIGFKTMNLGFALQEFFESGEAEEDFDECLDILQSRMETLYSQGIITTGEYYMMNKFITAAYGKVDTMNIADIK